MAVANGGTGYHQLGYIHFDLSDLVRACVIHDNAWPVIEEHWWRAITELRLKRLEHYALERCYDRGGGSRPLSCHQDPDADEPNFIAID